MPYLVVRGTPVFLTAAKYATLRELALAQWPADRRVASSIRGTDANRKAERHMEATLAHLAATCPSFHEEWVRFSLIGTEAQSEFDSLLFDWCEYSGSGHVVHAAPSLADIFGFDGPSIRDVVTVVKLRNRWLRRPVASAMFCLPLITSIDGELAAFVVKSEGYTVAFDSTGFTFLGAGSGVSGRYLLGAS